MNFPILINWTSSFPILGLLGGILFISFDFLKINFCKQTVEKLIRRRVPQKGLSSQLPKPSEIQLRIGILFRNIFL